MSSRREELEKRNCKFSPCFESSALRPIKSGWKNVQRLLHWIFNARCVIGLSVRMWFAKIIDRTKEKEMIEFWYRFCRWIFDYERLNLAHRLIINWTSGQDWNGEPFESMSRVNFKKIFFVYLENFLLANFSLSLKLKCVFNEFEDPSI